MVIEKTRSLFLVYRFYLAYINTVNFILKMFANSRFQFDQLEDLSRAEKLTKSQSAFIKMKMFCLETHFNFNFRIYVIYV